MAYIYLAHNFAAHDWLLKEVVPKIEAMGHYVTSDWIKRAKFHIERANKYESADRDLYDIRKADIVAVFVDQFADRHGKGKWVEFGYALALGKIVYLVGTNRDCVFEAILTEYYKCKTVQDFLEKVAIVRRVNG